MEASTREWFRVPRTEVGVKGRGEDDRTDSMVGDGSNIVSEGFTRQER